ncbi:unnamed protein product, partial [Discosporangium mesarthrocarpum]
MLEGTVLQESRGKGDTVVGISWHCGHHTKYNPSLVVTCVHQVIVFKPEESRRTHQWSFKPSASTALSHAAVFQPACAYYVAVRRGVTLVSWREADQSIEKPISAKAPGSVQAIHPCPRLGDALAVVMESGTVALFTCGLREICRAAGPPPSAGGQEGRGLRQVVWSGVVGHTLAVIEEEDGGGGERINLFALTPPQSDSAGGKTQPSNTPTVTLSASHPLEKPPLRAAGDATAATRGGDDSATPDNSARACSATLHSSSNNAASWGGGGALAISVGWRTPRGPVWTKFHLSSTGGARLEFAKRVGLPLQPPSRQSSEDELAVTAAVAQDHAAAGSAPPNADDHGRGGSRSDVILSMGPRSQVLFLCRRQGGRGGKHGGSAPPPPLVSVWDATYGVLLEEGPAPAHRRGGWGSLAAQSESPPWQGMQVSWGGSYVAFAGAGGVIASPLPTREGAGTLASILRRKHGRGQGQGLAGRLSTATAEAGPGEEGKVDLSRWNTGAMRLLEKTGPVDAREWEPMVGVSWDAEARTVETLRRAALRGDAEGFAAAMEEHCLSQQQQQHRDRGEGGGPRGGWGEGGGGSGCYSTSVVAEAVELCLLYPKAGLWGVFESLVNSRGVSARHHHGMISTLLKHAPPQLLEQVLVNVPDLPETDAVRILQHFLAKATAPLASLASPSPPGATTAALEGSAKMAFQKGLVRGGGGGGGGTPTPTGGGVG